ncbi:MAG: competence/damage-inducible protein A [Peptococcaceae bacterium]|nr:competence/damage-inducible protein A [Peptococcaceae bacterium]
MIAEIIATGTELLLGETLNLSTRYLSEQMSSLGIEVHYQIAVDDDRERLRGVMAAACARSDLVFVTGGLGPTYDDLSREVAAEVVGTPLVFDSEQLRRIDGFFQGKSPSEGSDRQARFPEGSEVLENTVGTAPGIFVPGLQELTPETSAPGKPIIVLLPGPPLELASMFENQVVERLRAILGSRPRLLVRVLKVFGFQETELERMIEDEWGAWRVLDPAESLSCVLLDQHTYLELRLCVRGLIEEEARALLERADAFWSGRLGRRVFARDEQSHAGVAVELLRERGLTLATAESCTGGLLGGRVTDVSGSSAVYQGGVVSYSNQAKMSLLGVAEESLQRFGAVSEVVAREMARGARKALGSDLALATTGVAGPDGGTAEKPVGLVFIALADAKGEKTLCKEFQGDRDSVRNMAVEAALDLLKQYLDGDGVCSN